MSVVGAAAKTASGDTEEGTARGVARGAQEVRHGRAGKTSAMLRQVRTSWTMVRPSFPLLPQRPVWS